MTDFIIGFVVGTTATITTAFIALYGEAIAVTTVKHVINTYVDLKHWWKPSTNVTTRIEKIIKHESDRYIVDGQEYIKFTPHMPVLYFEDDVRDDIDEMIIVTHSGRKITTEQEDHLKKIMRQAGGYLCDFHGSPPTTDQITERFPHTKPILENIDKIIINTCNMEEHIIASA